jgi:hypothetical protein
MWFQTGDGDQDQLGAVRRDMALTTLVCAGVSRKAAVLLIAAGYTSTAALREAPWSAKEAGDSNHSAEWRLGVTPGSSSLLLNEIRTFREAELAVERDRTEVRHAAQALARPALPPLLEERGDRAPGAGTPLHH